MPLSCTALKHNLLAIKRLYPLHADMHYNIQCIKISTLNFPSAPMAGYNTCKLIYMILCQYKD